MQQVREESSGTNGGLSSTVFSAAARQSTVQCLGLLGLLQFPTGPYLIGVGAREAVGTWCGETVWRVTQPVVMQLARNEATARLPSEQARLENMYVNGVREMLAHLPLFACHTADISRKLGTVPPVPGEDQSIWVSARRRFVWNTQIASAFLDAGLDQWVVPVIQGYVGYVRLSSELTYTLVSRRCCKRAGARYHTRGVDEAGNVANFVETEAVLSVNRSGIRGAGPGTAGNLCTSFVQVRGSIPVFWHHAPLGAKYNPLAILDRSTLETTASCSKHFKWLTGRYGSVCVLSLCNRSGPESVLVEEYQRQLKLLPMTAGTLPAAGSSSPSVWASNVSATALQAVKNGSTPPDATVVYIPIDFHAVSRHEGARSALDLLKAWLSPLVREWGVNVLGSDYSVLQRQSGVFRVNCIDCLDRTNMAQCIQLQL
jgi:hypothetical protein